ncbi:hypothetical protein [Pseudomonas aeruginosa]|uniref:hypothetical protein n=1 Tax=Pseudomonas aeruginosa TaxID=287 RepID=UPI001F4A2871|nr:hypothetical protein [Pseudomonas aeruginosa]
MEQAMREEFEDRFPVPEGIEWRPGDYFPIYTENVHEYIGRCGRASRYADMWAAWQASRAALRVELPFPIIVDEGAEFALHAYDKGETDKALQQAGIEVK